MPSEVFEDIASSQDSEATVEGGITAEDEVEIFVGKEQDLLKIKREVKHKTRNTVSRHVSGRELTSDTVIDSVKEHQNTQKNKSAPKKTRVVTAKTKKAKTIVQKKTKVVPSSPVAGPSHINLALDSQSSFDDSCSVEDSEKCCVCGLFQPRELANCVSLTFVKWAQCDGVTNGTPCKHWTHLIYCTPVRVIRRGDTFHCPHCKLIEE